MKGRGMGGHVSPVMETDVWLTPPEIIKALGIFDLDPCSPIGRPWDTAKKHFDILDDGLKQEWSGRIWCNPPYGLQATTWLKKLAGHGNGVALIFARTETKMFFSQVWNRADAIFFFEGRLHFYNAAGERAKANAGAPSCLIAYGQNNVAAIEGSGLKGKLVKLTTVNQSTDDDLKRTGDL